MEGKKKIFISSGIIFLVLTISFVVLFSMGYLNYFSKNNVKDKKSKTENIVRDIKGDLNKSKTDEKKYDVNVSNHAIDSESGLKITIDEQKNN